MPDTRLDAKPDPATEPAAEDALLEVNNIEVIYNHVILVLKGVSLSVPKGGITALLGGNGAGKTTLVRLLLGEIEPDEGTVRQSKTLEVTYQDQTRDTLNPKDTVWEALAPAGGDSIMVQGNQRHVAAYAKDFLFCLLYTSDAADE